jgi:phosphoribosyl-ATP pyrophosphohydrolase/phosphoribosyl-AMP cyclohydrolase
MPFDASTVKFDGAGLAPAVVQDDRTGAVLMLGYMNEESLRRTIDSGLVTFWSRSRQELWQKGATSGNSLRVVEIASDCDGDALLVTARPAGPTCHTGETSCFGAATGSQGFAQLEQLWAVIADRVATMPAGSYTAELVSQGVNATTRKLTEEATEVLLAAKDHAGGLDRGELAEEAADLIYHLLVVLAERGTQPAAVLDVLERRS